jgi:hypothetical protein
MMVEATAIAVTAAVGILNADKPAPAAPVPVETTATGEITTHIKITTPTIRCQILAVRAQRV